MRPYIDATKRSKPTKALLGFIGLFVLGAIPIPSEDRRPWKNPPAPPQVLAPDDDDPGRPPLMPVG